MKAAVLVLTHNSASYIGRTLTALQNALASYPLLESVRIYDDDSVDDTCDVVQRMWTSLVPLRISRAAQNQGECCNSNRAFQDLKTDGIDWGILLHADDEMTPGWLAKALDVAASSHASLGMICCNTRYVTATRPPTGGTAITDPGQGATSCGDVRIYDGTVETIHRLKNEWFWNVSGSVIRTERYCRVGGFLPKLTYAGDNDFLVRFLLDGNDVAYAETPFIVKYHHPQCMTSRLIRSGEYAVGWAHLMLRHARFATTLERTEEFWANVVIALRRALTAAIKLDTATVRGQGFAIRILVLSWIALVLRTRVFIPSSVRLLLETPHSPL